MESAPGAATFRAPADAYDRHVGRYGPPLARALISAAGVGAVSAHSTSAAGPGP